MASQDFLPAIFSKAAQVVRAKSQMMGQQTEQQLQMAQSQYNNHMGRLKMLMDAQQAKEQMDMQKERLSLAQKGMDLQAEHNKWSQKYQKDLTIHKIETRRQDQQREAERHKETQQLEAERRQQDLDRQAEQAQLTLQHRERMLGRNQFTQRKEAVDGLVQEYGTWDQVPDHLKHMVTGWNPRTTQQQGMSSGHLGILGQAIQKEIENLNEMSQILGAFPGGKEGWWPLDHWAKPPKHSNDDFLNSLKGLATMTGTVQRIGDSVVMLDLQQQIRQVVTQGAVKDRIVKGMQGDAAKQQQAITIYNTLSAIVGLPPITPDQTGTSKDVFEQSERQQAQTKKSTTIWERIGRDYIDSNLEKARPPRLSGTRFDSMTPTPGMW